MSQRTIGARPGWSRTSPSTHPGGTTTEERTTRRDLNRSARAYLERIGQTMVAPDSPSVPQEVDLLGIDGDTPVGTLVLLGTRPEEMGGVPERTLDAALRAIAAYRDAHHAECSRIRVDTVSLLIIAEDRALLRHHRGVRSG